MALEFILPLASMTLVCAILVLPSSSYMCAYGFSCQWKAEHPQVHTSSTYILAQEMSRMSFKPKSKTNWPFSHAPAGFLHFPVANHLICIRLALVPFAWIITRTFLRSSPGLICCPVAPFLPQS